MTTAYLEDDEIQRIASAVADELENRGAAMAALDQRVKEQAERIAELEDKLSAAEAWGHNEVQRANTTADHVIAEYDQRIVVLEALVTELRCGDLHRYFDRELLEDRRAAFDLHLASCGSCQHELAGLMQETVAASGASATKNATATRRTRKR